MNQQSPQTLASTVVLTATTISLILVVVGLTMIILSLFGCGELIELLRTDTHIDPMMIYPDVIPIGVILPLTGAFSEPYGIPVKNGLELAKDEINDLRTDDLPIQLIIKDSGDDPPAGAISAFTELVLDQKLGVIIGPTFSREALHLFPLARHHSVLMFSPTSTQSGLNEENDQIFRTGLTNDRIIPHGVKVTMDALGYTTVGLIYDQIDSYSINSNATLMSALTQNGVEIKIITPIKTGDIDMVTQLTEVIEAEPDAIFVSALANEIELVLLTAQEIGIETDIPFIIPEFTIDDARRAGAAAANVITFVSWDSAVNTPESLAFVEKYKAVYGTEPIAPAAQAYATLHLLAEAISRAQSTGLSEITSALANLADVPTILGEFSFDPGGDAIYEPLILKVHIEDGDLDLVPFTESPDKIPELP